MANMNSDDYPNYIVNYPDEAERLMNVRNFQPTQRKPISRGQGGPFVLQPQGMVDDSVVDWGIYNLGMDQIPDSALTTVDDFLDAFHNCISRGTVQRVFDTNDTAKIRYFADQLWYCLWSKKYMNRESHTLKYYCINVDHNGWAHVYLVNACYGNCTECNACGLVGIKCKRCNADGHICRAAVYHPNAERHEDFLRDPDNWADCFHIGRLTHGCYPTYDLAEHHAAHSNSIEQAEYRDPRAEHLLRKFDEELYDLYDHVILRNIRGTLNVPDEMARDLIVEYDQECWGNDAPVRNFDGN